MKLATGLNMVNMYVVGQKDQHAFAVLNSRYRNSSKLLSAILFECQIRLIRISPKVPAMIPSRSLQYVHIKIHHVIPSHLSGTERRG